MLKGVNENMKICSKVWMRVEMQDLKKNQMGTEKRNMWIEKLTACN